MNIKKKIGMALMAGATTMTTQIASAEGFMDDVRLVPQLGFAVKHLRFEQSISDAFGGKFSGDFDADIPTLTGSLTAVKGKAYVSIKIEKSLDDGQTKSSVPLTEDFLTGGDGDGAIDRKDMSITFGYNVWSSVNVFVGYLRGETKVKPVKGDGLSFIQKNYEQTYEEDGWFLGSSYSWAFETGTLSASVAYADLDGTYEDNFSNFFGPGQSLFRFEGDADGFSYGLNWSAPLTEKVGYYVDLRRQSYEFDAKDTGQLAFSGFTVENKEVITALSAGLQWYF